MEGWSRKERDGERRVQGGKEGRVEGGAEKGPGREGNRQLQPLPLPSLSI